MSESEKNDVDAKKAAAKKKLASPDVLEPAKPRLGESAKNLREREAWFRKRSTGGPKRD